MEDEEQTQTQSQQIDKFKKGMENKLTDVIILASWATMEGNARRDKKCKGLKRKASSKCCVYCMSHEGTYSFSSVNDGAMGGKHEACKCKVTPVFQEIKTIKETKKKSRSDIINEAKKDAQITNLSLVENVEPTLFRNCLIDMKNNDKINGGAVDVHDLKTYQECKKLFLSKDGACGVAIKQDGDIISVFKNPRSDYKNAIHDLLITARENGGVKLDCYGETLVNKYEECGFRPVARVKFDPQFVTDEKLLRKKPDIYFMIKTEADTLEVIDRIGKKIFNRSEIKDLEKLPIMTYDEAAKFRDGLL